LGYEDDEDARFVFLPDCKHTIEEKGLLGYMKTLKDSEAVKYPECPKCKTLIFYCQRI